MPFTLATFNTYWLFDNKVPLSRWGIKLPEGGLEEKIEITANAINSIVGLTQKKNLIGAE